MGVRDKWDSYRLYDGVSIYKKTFLTDLGEGHAITECVCPLTVQTDNYNWDDPSTIAGDLWGLHVVVSVGETPAGNSTLLRLEPNTKGITLGSAFDVPVGGGGDLSYLFTLNPSGGISAWSATWIKIKVGGDDRWIALLPAQP